MPKKFSQEREQDIRTRILEEATRICSAAGMKYCTVDQLCDHVGISKGSFYRFFSSKEELEDVCLAAAEQELQMLLCSFIRDDTPAEDALSQVFSTLLRSRPIRGVHLAAAPVLSTLHERGSVCDFSSRAFEQLLGLLYAMEPPEDSGGELLSSVLHVGISAYIRD